jgi:hypothetical protein
MRVAIVKRQPKRRRRIPRRPHPDLVSFFGRHQHTDVEANDNARPGLADLEHRVRSQRRD